MNGDTLALLASTFVIGIAVAAPVGAMAIMCIDRTLARGWSAGMATGLGIATADAAYAAIAAFGVTAVSAALVEWQAPLRVVGGLALVVLGVRSAIAKPEPALACADSSEGEGRARLYLSALGLTLTNPMTIMAFAAVFVGAGITVSPDLVQALVATLGVGLGSLSWWLVLVTVSSLVRHGLGPGLRLWLGRVSGVVLALFGVLAVAAGFLPAR